MGNTSVKKKFFRFRHTNSSQIGRQGYEQTDFEPKDESDYAQLEQNFYSEIKDHKIRQDLYVVALDIGTSSCGYAISVYDQYKRDPLQISTFGWPSKSDGFLHHKTLSAVLLDDSGRYHSFGFDAEYHYVNNLTEEERRQWFYFQNFKMKLYSDEISRELELHDVDGKAQSALKIFSLMIKALKNNLLSKLQQHISNVEDSDIHWVITVPAIWNEKAKQFMREASRKAGILDGQLSIALEPEAAALYCRHLPVEKLKGLETNERKTFQPGSHYLIVDIGGGTVDITSHRILPNGALQETMAASGGEWGSLAINEQFLKFFEDFTVKGLFEEMKKLYPEDYVIFLSAFEQKKKVFSLSDDRVIISLPQSLRNLAEEKLGTSMEQHIHAIQRTSDVKCYRDKMFIYKDAFVNLLKSTIDNMILHIMSLFATHNLQVNSIVLVGGFAESELVRTIFQSSFPDVKIIVPDDAVLAVLKGAVLFGRNPNILNARVCRFTYGICTNRNFIENTHCEAKKITIQGKPLVKDIFNIHIRANETIYAESKMRALKYFPSKKGQNKLDLKIYATKDPSPNYVTDSGVVYMGMLSIDVQAPMAEESSEKFFLVSFLLDGTELEVLVTDSDSQQKASAKFDFLG